MSPCYKTLTLSYTFTKQHTETSVENIYTVLRQTIKYKT